MYCNEDDEYILFIDGLLYKGKYFPHERLDPENSKYIERVHSMCMNGEWKIIKIGQNAAQINHRMRMNQGFTFYVNFTRQKNPLCHFILQAQHLDFDQIYLLHNERGAKNCSISIANLPFTKKSPMNYLAITMTDAKLHTEKRGIDTAKILKEKQPCTSIGLNNYVLIGSRKEGLQYCLPYSNLPLDFLAVDCDAITI
ncbi:hypothetical protein BLA29_006873, partial [Euroglyphus maynei]